MGAYCKTEGWEEICRKFRKAVNAVEIPDGTTVSPFDPAGEMRRVVARNFVNDLRPDLCETDREILLGDLLNHVPIYQSAGRRSCVVCYNPYAEADRIAEARERKEQKALRREERLRCKKEGKPMPRTKKSNGEKTDKSKAERKPRAPRVVSEEELRAKYPHVIAGTLQPPSNGVKKWSAEIACAVCGKTRRVYTSDLFQVKVCSADCKKALKGGGKTAAKGKAKGKAKGARKPRAKK